LQYPNFTTLKNMSRRTEIAEILKAPKLNELVTIMGWVRAFRANRFIALNDGSTTNNLQVVVDFENFDKDLLKKVSFHALAEARIRQDWILQGFRLLSNSLQRLGQHPETQPILP
jgi:asparaginyl-tRNA synthetase